MHEHDSCEHNLKYCKICDVVYCTKCGREWGLQHYHCAYVPQVYSNVTAYGTE